VHDLDRSATVTGIQGYYHSKKKAPKGDGIYIGPRAFSSQKSPKIVLMYMGYKGVTVSVIVQETATICTLQQGVTFPKRKEFQERQSTLGTRAFLFQN
jgi:hypothetical protein